MAIVITGSSGFIGSRLVARALTSGEDVVGIDRTPPRSWLVERAKDCPGRLTAVVSDLLAPALHDDLRRYLEAADAVVHCAARSGVRNDTSRPPSALDPAALDAAALDAARERDILHTAQLLLALTPASRPMVVLSSSAVYGGATDDVGRTRPRREDEPLHPVGRYAGWKVRVEQECARRADAGGRIVVVRPFTVVGEGQRPDMAVARWLAAARSGAELQVLGGLERTRDVTDVEHVVTGVLAALGTGFTGTLNLGSGRPRTLREIIEAVTDALVAAGIEHPPVRLRVTAAAAEEVESSWACTERARLELGLDLSTDLDAVIRRQLAHRLQQEHTPRRQLLGV